MNLLNPRLALSAPLHCTVAQPGLELPEMLALAPLMLEVSTPEDVHGGGGVCILYLHHFVKPEKSEPFCTSTSKARVSTLPFLFLSGVLGIEPKAFTLSHTPHHPKPFQSFYLRQGLSKLSRLGLTWRSSCFGLPQC